MLSLVRDQPSWGYEVRARFLERYSTVILPRDAAVYEALDRLEQAGLVEPFGEQDAGDGSRRAQRTHYRITHAGVDELHVWPRAELPDDDPAQELLVRMRSIDLSEIDLFLTLLNEYEQHVRDQLKNLPCERRGTVGSWRRELYRLRWSAELDWILWARPYLRKLKGRTPQAAPT